MRITVRFIAVSYTHLLVLTAALFTTSAFAADSDPLTIVNNLSDFIFSCIKAIGIIILGWGVVQLGMSVQSHDATQRTQGVLCLFGGLLLSLIHIFRAENCSDFSHIFQSCDRIVHEFYGII